MVARTIAEYFEGKRVLVTGGTGFVGKILIEKLLRCCPGIDTVYVMVRTKRGQSPRDRWNEIAKQEVFDLVRQQQPQNLNKIVLIGGDISVKNLGISEEDKKVLLENVNVIFHVAATVLFFECIADSLKMNVRGTYVLLELAREMKKLKCFLHVSTAYCNVEKPFTAVEKVYPSIQDWRHLLQVLETTDPYVLGCLTSKIIAGHPNSYTLTKSLAEVIVDEYKQHFPVVIIRPSIVLNCVKEPFPGWVDNLNGPAVAGILTSAGVLRVQYAKGTSRLDYTSVDIVANSAIVAVWETDLRKDNETRVYNCTFGDRINSTMETFRRCGLEYTEHEPFDEMLWKPHMVTTESPLIYYLLFIVLQVIPAALVDTAVKLSGKKPKLWKITKKIAVAHQAFKFFVLNSFLYPIDRFEELKKKVLPEDRETFYLDLPDDFDEYECIRMCGEGIKQFVIKQKKTLEQRRSLFRRMEILDAAVRSAFVLLTSWYFVDTAYSIISFYATQ